VKTGRTYDHPDTGVLLISLLVEALVLRHLVRGVVETAIAVVSIFVPSASKVQANGIRNEA